MCGSCIEWGGKRWHRYGDWYYQSNGTKSKGRKDRDSLHRAVWRHHHGEIPEGAHVHHIDGDKTNNAIENLSLASASTHIKIHMLEDPPRAVSTDELSARFKRMWSRRVAVDRVCLQCGGDFKSKSLQPSDFCSSVCLEAARAIRFEPVARKCDHCGKDYTATRSSARYCSELCNSRSMEARLKAGVAELREVACACCGVTFESKRLNARFCGRVCAVRYHGKHQHRITLKQASARLRSGG